MAQNDKEDSQRTDPTNQVKAASRFGSLASLTKEQLLEALGLLGTLPVNITSAPYLPIDTGERLGAKPRLTVLFPPCSNELLSLINTTQTDEITSYFREYFVFQRHVPLGQAGNPPVELSSQLGGVVDAALLNGCPTDGVILSSTNSAPAWPSDCCVCSPCVRLDGNRDQLNLPPHIRRLFIGDAVWLFWLGERLGIFQILGAILDAYALTGKIPISSGSIDPGPTDDVTAVVLEVMVRQMKQGLASTVRDRSSLFRTSLGWDSPLGMKLQLDTQVNTAFNSQFHRLILGALEWYRDLRLAEAIRTTAIPATPSTSTLVTIKDTIDMLKKRFEAWEYGRNLNNTLSAIVWTIAGMSVIRELRTTLGIPPAYDQPHEYIPAAWDLLVAKRSITSGEANRYDLHRRLAMNGRDILLDLEVINFNDTSPGGELERWLHQVEGKVEEYRTAYRTLTGTDLGSSPAAIEQQA
jgi:hypothetical protein